MILDNESTAYSGIGSSYFYGGPILVAEDNINSNNLLHEQYNVFVNDDYVGKKVLIADNEKPSDLEKYLYSQGFSNFETIINQTDIKINCNTDVDKMETILNSYLHNK